MELISQREYARRRGVAPSLINRHVKEGKIKLVDGKINPVQADKILNKDSNGKGGGEYFKQQSRLVKAKADKAELEYLRLSDELVPAEEVRVFLDKMLSSFKSRLLSLPSKVAPIIIAENEIGGAIIILEQAVEETINELRSYDPNANKFNLQKKGGGHFNVDESEDSKPAAETKRKRMVSKKSKVKRGIKRGTRKV